MQSYCINTIPGLVVVLDGHDPKSTSARARAAAAAERYAREQLVELCAGE
jgi:hypothetical protein